MNTPLEEKDYSKALIKLQEFLESNPSLITLTPIANGFNKAHPNIGFKTSDLLDGLRKQEIVERLPNSKYPLNFIYRINKGAAITPKQAHNINAQTVIMNNSGNVAVGKDINQSLESNINDAYFDEKSFTSKIFWQLLIPLSIAIISLIIGQHYFPDK